MTKTEVLLITLERLHCCTTYQKLAVNYGLQRSTICNVVNYGLAFLDDGYREPLRDIRRWVHYVPQWCEAVERKTEGTSPPLFLIPLPFPILSNPLTPHPGIFPYVWGFIDVVVQRIRRISGILVQNAALDPQRRFYCGYKGFHALKYQGAEAPCGICVNFFGPGMGSASDSTMMYDSGILQDLQDVADFYGYQFGLYGDPAYPASAVIYKPHMPAAPITATQSLFQPQGGEDTSNFGVGVWRFVAVLALC